jgi:hypothetical protein
MQAKPVAVYKAASLLAMNTTAAVGERVSVEVVTHPAQRLNGKQVITTPITRVGDFGVFETENTVYIPEERQLPVVQ